MKSAWLKGADKREANEAGLLEAKGIEVTYGGKVRVLHGIDLTIRKGEAVGIVGESGSGKSTLGRALLRLTPVSAGMVTFDGQDITTLSPARMRPLRLRMQMIFQDPMASLNPRHSIGRILSEPLYLHGLAENRHDAERQVKAMLDRVSLSPVVLGRSPHELSGGQRQRVGIARAALLKPDFVLADEVVSGLDVSTQAMVLNLLKELSREMGLAMAFISHDLSVIRAICDRVYVLRFGEVVEQGPCATIFDAPRSDYTRHLLDAIPLPEIDPDWLNEKAAPKTPMEKCA